MTKPIARDPIYRKRAFDADIIEPGHGPRTYVQDIQGGAPRALTPEGIAGSRVTPDGKYVLARDLKRQEWLYPIAGGEPQRLNLDLTANEIPLRFSPDGKSLLVLTRGIPLKIARADLATGQREPRQ